MVRRNQTSQEKSRSRIWAGLYYHHLQIYLDLWIMHLRALGMLSDVGTFEIQMLWETVALKPIFLTTYILLITSLVAKPSSITPNGPFPARRKKAMHCPRTELGVGWVPHHIGPLQHRCKEVRQKNLGLVRELAKISGNMYVLPDEEKLKTVKLLIWYMCFTRKYHSLTPTLMQNHTTNKGPPKKIIQIHES